MRMAEILMFKKRDSSRPPSSEGERKEGEVVILPGLNFSNLLAAWGYFKKTGRSHEPPEAPKKKASS